jgi:hypothetical protein
MSLPIRRSVVQSCIYMDLLLEAVFPENDVYNSAHDAKGLARQLSKKYGIKITPEEVKKECEELDNMRLVEGAMLTSGPGYTLRGNTLRKILGVKQVG